MGRGGTTRRGKGNWNEFAKRGSKSNDAALRRRWRINIAMSRGPLLAKVALINPLARERF